MLPLQLMVNSQFIRKHKSTCSTLSRRGLVLWRVNWQSNKVAAEFCCELKNKTCFILLYLMRYRKTTTNCRKFSPRMQKCGFLWKTFDRFEAFEPAILKIVSTSLRILSTVTMKWKKYFKFIMILNDRIIKQRCQ